MCVVGLTACGQSGAASDADQGDGGAAGGERAVADGAAGSPDVGAAGMQQASDLGGGAGRTSQEVPSPIEGLWETAKLPADRCEDYRTQPSSRFLRVRRTVGGTLELVQLALGVPSNELNDPGYEPCSAPLAPDGAKARITEPYTCATIARNPNGTASQQPVFRKIDTDELTLVGETLHEHRVDSAEYGNYDCPGVRDFSYTRSNKDRSGQLSLTRSPSVKGYWRTTQGLRESPGLYVELDLEQTGLKVEGTFQITSYDSGTLSGVLSGTRLRGMEVQNAGDPSPFEFVFSADGKRFVGTVGKVVVWNGAND
jgi:hypothetical protein